MAEEIDSGSTMSIENIQAWMDHIYHAPYRQPMVLIPRWLEIELRSEYGDALIDGWIERGAMVVHER